MKIRKTSSGWIALAIAVVLLAVDSRSALALEPPPQFNLADLIAQGGEITVGDKLFTDFGFQSGDFLAGDVTVQPIEDVQGNLGLRFQAAWSALNEIADFTLSFSVTATDPSQQITDVHLTLGEVVVLGSGHVIVGEDIFDSTDTKIADITTVHPPESAEGDAEFAPQTTITVRKDIELYAPGTEGENTATLSYIDQTFSQIPEPGAAMLVMAGLAGMLVIMRRR